MTNIENFSIDQLAGQRLMVGFEGTEFNRELEFLIKEFDSKDLGYNYHIKVFKIDK